METQRLTQFSVIFTQNLDIISIFVKTYVMLTELKAKAYDLLAQLEYLQKQLQEVNQQIAEEIKKNEDTSN